MQRWGPGDRPHRRASGLASGSERQRSPPSCERVLSVCMSLGGGRGTRQVYKYCVAAAKLLQSCLILCDPIDGSPPGSPVPGILQARTLEWIAISFSNAPPPDKDLESPSSRRLEALVPSRDSRARTRSPSPRAW